MTPNVAAPLRRSDLKRQYDREQWTANSASTYVSQVIGEAGEFLTREIYFGRAYEGPPFLNWDIVLGGDWWPDQNTQESIALAAMTVGVNNWIIDDRGAYIGARLWVVIPCEVFTCGA